MKKLRALQRELTTPTVRAISKTSTEMMYIILRESLITIISDDKKYGVGI